MAKHHVTFELPVRKLGRMYGIGLPRLRDIRQAATSRCCRC